MTLVMLRSEYWDQLSKTSSEFWIKVVRIHEVVFFLLVLGIMTPMLFVFDFGAKLAITTVQNETYHTIGLNPLYGHPIQLKGHLCWPADLNVCLMQPSSSDPCCTELYNKDASIEQSVSDTELMLIVAFLSIGVIVLRCGMWQLFTSRREQQQKQQPEDHPNPDHQIQKIQPIDKRFWWKILWDSFIALGIAMIITFIVTEYVKAAVGAPRPNYYALQLFSSVHHSARTDFEDNSQLSFPSGHASTSLAGLGLASLFCFQDCLNYRLTAPLTSFCLILVSAVPLAVAFFIGLTRVSNMWHFAEDVLVGWVIGGSCLFCSYAAFSGHAKDIHRALEPVLPPCSSSDIEMNYHLGGS